MSNPFSGIITGELKLLHKNMIDSLLEDDALTVPCTLIYADTKFTECPNCLLNASTGKSSGKYRSGGPIPFSQGNCPYCNGSGKVKEQSLETLYLMAIWDSKRWLLGDLVKTADIDVQTMSKITTYDNLKRCSKLQINNKITNYGVPEFTRVGDPQPLGWGDDNFIICSWKRA